MKTKELTGRALDYAVALAEGYSPEQALDVTRSLPDNPINALIAEFNAQMEKEPCSTDVTTPPCANG